MVVYCSLVRTASSIGYFFYVHLFAIYIVFAIAFCIIAIVSYFFSHWGTAFPSTLNITNCVSVCGAILLEEQQ